ncbi:MFS transporter [Ruficoccus amylovorans]|uniref:MFS transporter n=1 Tax=Ruficoccus amylovorans TaxID=1804625 RepID=A0A842HE96_9BACT|nr:MFS transporter [Ruficoccus amylovorans]MBC2594569.1 MFS transporter [Ruficoccus amylovorans]
MRPDVPFRPDRIPFFYGWVVVGASVMGMVSSMPGQTAGVGPFTEDLLANLDLTRLQLSIAYLGGTVASGLILPRIGRFFDRFGARLTGTLVEIGLGLSLFYMASCSAIYHWLKPGEEPLPYLALAVVMFGFFLIRFLGQGVVAMTSRAMLGKWFNRKRGLASAIAGSVGGVCFAAAPLGLYGAVSWLGWREAWVLMGLVLIFVVSGLCWLFYRDNPEECGLVMDGEPPPPEPTGPTDPEFNIHYEFTAREAIRTYSFWVFTAAFSLISVFMTAVNFHAVDIAREMGREPSNFFRLYLWMTCVSIPSGFVIGWLTGRMRLKPLLVVMGASMTLAAFGLLHLSYGWGVVVYVAGGGLSSSFFGTLMAVVYPRFFGRQHLGAVSGWVMLTMVICSAIAPLLWSVSEELAGSYSPVTWLYGACCAAVAVAAFFADNPQRRLAARNRG